jgi:hypothetical protein
MAAETALDKGMKIKSIILFTAIGLVLLVGVGFGVKFLVKGMKDKSAQRQRERDAQKNIITKELSFSPAEYTSMASRLYKAFEGWGTTWNTVKSIVTSLKNKSDFWTLYNKFGTKDDMDLPSYLEDELDESEMRTITDHLTKIGVSI